jgi:hypothetical protein
LETREFKTERAAALQPFAPLSGRLAEEGVFYYNVELLDKYGKKGDEYLWI